MDGVDILMVLKISSLEFHSYITDLRIFPVETLGKDFTFNTLGPVQNVPMKRRNGLQLGDFLVSL